MQRLTLFLAISTTALFGCGGSGGSEDQTSQENTTVNEKTTRTEIFGQNGNIWKPSGDPTAAGAGNLVVLLSAEFTSQFDNCEVRTNDGQIAQLYCINTEPWTQIPFSCFSNGDRQTWRANFKCGNAAEVSVTCRDVNQEVTFTVDSSIRNQVCSRH